MDRSTDGSPAGTAWGDARTGTTPAVLGRLARFDGGTFTPVAEGTVDAPFVHVFVHGWMPGFRTLARLLATGDGVAAVPAWDARLVDPDGRAVIADYLPLLEALHDLGDDHAALVYSWLDESATDADVLLAQRSRQATQINGRRLAVALQRALARPHRSRLHLLGHSHGSAVVTHAAVSLRRPPDHLTFLDAPESPVTRLGGAADLIDVVLPRLRPGREPGRTFVDSYASAFGAPYHRRPGLSDVVDVSLTPPLTLTRDPVRALTAAHLYPVDWYARSVRERHRGVGYGWSPLAAATGAGQGPAGLHPWYTSPLALRPLDVRRRPELPGAASAGRLARRAQVRQRPLEGAALVVTDAAPQAALSFTTVAGDQLVEFALVVRGGDGTEQVDLAVDGVDVFRSLARFPVPQAGRYLLLADGRPGEHLLTARLTHHRPPGRRRADDRAGETLRPATVRVVGLRVVNGPGGGVGFSPARTVGAAFVAGAASGSVATLVTLVATGWTARRVLAALTRRRTR